MGFGEEHHRDTVPFSPHHTPWSILSIGLITVDVRPDDPAEAMLVRFLHLPTSFTSVLFWKRSHHAQPTLKERGARLHLGEERASTQIIWSSSAREICLFSFIYSIIYLYQYGTMYIYFILWGFNPLHFTYFLAQIIPTSATGSSFSWLLSPFDTFPSLWVCLFKYFLNFGTTRCSRLILYTSCPSPRISNFSKEPWLFLLEDYIRNQDLGISCTLATGVSLLLGGQDLSF